MDNESALQAAKIAILEAGRIALRHQAKGVVQTNKTTDYGTVTAADLAVEAFLKGEAGK